MMETVECIFCRNSKGTHRHNEAWCRNDEVAK